MKRAINFTMYFLILSFLIIKIPPVLDYFKLEGKSATIGLINEFTIESNLNSLKPINAIIFPKKGERSAVIFWASWCTPCKLELNRINKSIEEKKIDANQIFAISIDDDLEALKRAMIERKYRFKTYVDTKGNLVKSFKVAATPTIVFINDDLVIKWISSGFSPTLIARLETFLKK